jgi:hypothetical protein
MTEPTKTAPAVSPLSGDAGVIARLAAQKAKFKAAWRTLNDKVAGLEKQVTDLTAERDQLAVKADTSEVAKRLDAKTAELRTLKHQLKFNELATAKGADPKLLPDLWKLAEVQVETDEPDAAALQTLIDAQKTARSWAFGQPADPNAPPPPKPAPGSGQGGSITATSQFSEAQLQDPKFVMMNFDRISQAANDRIQRGEI